VREKPCIQPGFLGCCLVLERLPGARGAEECGHRDNFLVRGCKGWGGVGCWTGTELPRFLKSVCGKDTTSCKRFALCACNAVSLLLFSLKSLPPLAAWSWT